MKKVFYFFKMVVNMVKLAMNPNSTICVFKIADSLYKMNIFKIGDQRPLADFDSLEILKNRKRMGHYEISELNMLPEATLGKAYAEHMIANNLKPDFFTEIEIRNDATYFMMRMRETHDLWHTVTGFKTDVPGEIGLQAFIYAQVQIPLAPILIAGSLFVSVFKDPAKLPLIFSSVAKGWEMGQNAKVIFGLNWESQWQTPIQDLRKKYSVVSV